MQSKPGAPANYVERTEEPPPRRPIGDTEVNQLSHFSDLRRKWNALSAEEQEKYLVDGNWNPDAEPKAAKKVKTH